MESMASGKQWFTLFHYGFAQKLRKYIQKEIIFKWNTQEKKSDSERSPVMQKGNRLKQLLTNNSTFNDEDTAHSIGS